MRITADTNVLVRLIVADDAGQNATAVRTFENADVVGIGVHSLCELVWVLHRTYAVPRTEIVGVIRQLCETRNVVVDRLAVEAGLAVLEAGGDFADGAIAYEGRWLGGDTFVSFDAQAVKLIERQGQSAQLLT